MWEEMPTTGVPAVSQSVRLRPNRPETCSDSSSNSRNESVSLEILYEQLIKIATPRIRIGLRVVYTPILITLECGS